MLHAVCVEHPDFIVESPGETEIYHRFYPLQSHQRGGQGEGAGLPSGGLGGWNRGYGHRAAEGHGANLGGGAMGMVVEAQHQSRAVVGGGREFGQVERATGRALLLGERYQCLARLIGGLGEGFGGILEIPVEGVARVGLVHGQGLQGDFPVGEFLHSGYLIGLAEHYSFPDRGGALAGDVGRGDGEIMHGQGV